MKDILLSSELENVLLSTEMEDVLLFVLLFSLRRLGSTVCGGKGGIISNTNN